MAAVAYRAMSVAEFLAWNDGDDARYELVAGMPVAMAPPSPAHQILTMRLGGRIDRALADRPGCTVRGEAGILLPHRGDAYYQADVAVTCVPHARDQVGTPDPLLIAEVLSPSTEDHDRKVKLPDYRGIPSVREIVLVDSRRMFCEVHRRLDEARWLTDLLREPEARLRLESVGLDLPLAELYAGVALEAE